MATLYDEDFEGGANGANLTTGNTIFGAIASSPSPTFTTADAITGTRSMSCNSGGGNNDQYGTRLFGSSIGLLYARVYVKFTTMPSANSVLMSLFANTTIRAELRIRTSDMRLQYRDATTARWTSTNPLTTGVWYRIEWRVSDSANQAQVRIFSGANVHGATADDDSGNQTYTNGTTFDRVQLGWSTNDNGGVRLYDAFKGDDATWVGPVVVSQDGTLSASVGTATAAGGTGSLHGNATLTATVATAVADGGSTTLHGDARLTGSTGTATAAGGDGGLHGQQHATLASSTGAATAAGGTGSLHGDATLTSSTGTATASGGDGTLSGSGTAALTGEVGEATASGGESTFHGDARLAGTTGEASASGGTGAMSGQRHATLTSSTGTATADGGESVLRGAATLTADAATATASGGTSTLHGTAVLAATTGTAAAAGGESTLHGGATLTGDTGDAVADGGESSMFAFAPRDITLTGGLAPRRVAGDLEARHGGTLTTAVRDAALTTTRRGGLAPAHRRTGRIEHT